MHVLAFAVLIDEVWAASAACACAYIVTHKASMCLPSIDGAGALASVQLFRRDHAPACWIDSRAQAVVVKQACLLTWTV